MGLLGTALLAFASYKVVTGHMRRRDKKEAKRIDKQLRRAEKLQEREERLWAQKEEKRVRDSLPIRCSFTDGITSDEFSNIVRSKMRAAYRLDNFHIDGAKIYITVHSTTKLSSWNAVIDFNDNGHLTGSYKLFSDNLDSSIPGHIAEAVSAEIRERMAPIPHPSSPSNATVFTKDEQKGCLWSLLIALIVIIIIAVLDQVVT